MSKMRTKTDPVEMPSQFVDYWLEKAKPYEGTHPVECAYCDEPIQQGERFFYIHAMSNEPIKRGHVTHLKHAPQQEWSYDPDKRVQQPWEENPEIPAPKGWDKWKKNHEGTLYG